MIAQRALFTSDENRDVRGYHLVARSQLIDENLAQRLSVIGPTHGSLDGADVHTSSLNYCLVNDQWAVISRSATGGAEYSNRGSFRVVTTFLAVHERDMRAYHNNPYTVCRIAQGLGHLSIRFPVERRVAQVSLPDASILSRFPRPLAKTENSLVRHIAEGLGDTRPIAVIGAADPLLVVGHLFAIVPPEMRLWLSYSTGLKPSINRPFRVQFCAPCDDHQLLGLEAKGFLCIRAETR